MEPLKMDSFSDEFDRKIDRSLKLILLGDMDSRKSEIFHSFMNNKGQESENVGLDCFVKDIQYKEKVIRLQVWDTSGLERFRSVTASYYREANGILLVFNCEKQETFNSLDEWLSEIRELAPRDVVTYLVGTVSAHVSEDRITREMACRYAEIHSEELSSKLIAECNPKDDDIVERVFRSLVSAIIHTSERDTLPQGTQLTVRGSLEPEASQQQSRRSFRPRLARYRNRCSNCT